LLKIYYHNLLSPNHPGIIYFIDYLNNELAGQTIFIHGSIVPYWKDAVRLGSFVCHAKSKKMDGKADQAVNDEPYINKRKPSSTTAAKDDSNNGQVQKKRMETATKSLITNHLSTRGSH
jgi:hypothetical protein